MDGDVNLVVVAGAGDGDIAAGVVDVEAGSGGEGLDDGLIALVLVAHELVPVVLIEVEVGEELAASATADAAEDDSGDGEEDEEGDDASADATAVRGVSGVGLGVLVVGPLQEQDDAGADEEEGPETGVPLPEIVSSEGVRSERAGRGCRG